MFPDQYYDHCDSKQNREVILPIMDYLRLSVYPLSNNTSSFYCLKALRDITFCRIANIS